MNPSLQNPASVATEPENLYDFQPSAERVAFLDQRMRARLADSISYIFEQGEEYFTTPRARFEEFVAQLRSHPVSPLAFSFYCDIVLAIERDEVEEASALLESLVALPVHAGGPSVVFLGDPKVDPVSERYARFVDTDPETPFVVYPPSSEAAEKCSDEIDTAFAMMDAADPALSGELRRLVREIILAEGSKDRTAMTFDGASSFMLWGGIIINADRDDGALGMAQMIAHESAHNMLFGFSVDGPVLENGFDGRYPSPLRKDLRPLEGIYHATYVTARMHRAVKGLLDGGVLTPEQQEIARKELSTHERLFAGGMVTIREHGKMTPLGAAVIQGAVDYMAKAGG
jgi:HEXXH motif-containing protein